MFRIWVGGGLRLLSSKLLRGSGLGSRDIGLLSPPKRSIWRVGEISMYTDNSYTPYDHNSRRIIPLTNPPEP